MQALEARAVTGKAEGRTERKAELVLRQLARRFGPLTAAIEARVRAASAEQIDVIADRVLEAERLEDVLPRE